MCLSKVILDGAVENGEVIFEGYKLFTENNGVISNWNTGSIDYEYNKWYEAKLEGDKLCSQISSQNKYLYGFHFFLSESDIKNYTDSWKGHNKILKVKFKEIVSFGIENSIAHNKNHQIQCFCARYMMIEKPKLVIQNLKQGQRFKRVNTNNSSVFTLVGIHDELRIHGININNKYTHAYIDDRNNLYATENPNDEITLVD